MKQEVRYAQQIVTLLKILSKLFGNESRTTILLHHTNGKLHICHMLNINQRTLIRSQ